MNSEEDNGWYKNGKSSNKTWQNTVNKQIRGKPCMDVQKTVGYCAYSTECKLHLVTTLVAKSQKKASLHQRL